MPFQLGKNWSLKKKITLFTLCIFLLSMWTLAYAVINLMRSDMLDVFGEQLFASANMQAKDLNSDFVELIQGLEKTATFISPDVMDKPAQLQRFLEMRGGVLDRFNAGYFITDTHGIAIASVPLNRQRVGLSFSDREFVIGALQQNKTVIGKPVKGRMLAGAIIGMATPIHNQQGSIIGLLIGVINLNEPSFMDHFTDTPIGKTGGYWIVQPSENLIVTATDKSRIMSPLPKDQVSSLVARFDAGYEGFGVHLSTRGEEKITASSNVPVVGWRLAVSVSTSEAFAPIHHMQEQMLYITLLLTIVSGGLTWRMLLSQLNSLTRATETLASMTQSGNSFQPLPVAQKDEVGQLIGGFNSLLALVETRTHELDQERQNLANILEGTGAGTWSLNLQTGVANLNERWAEMLGYSLAELRPCSFEGWSKMCHASDLPKAEEALHRYVGGEGDSFDAVTRMRHKDGHWVWVQSRAKITERSADGQPLMISGINLDISQEKAFELSLVAAKEQAELASVAKSQFLSNMSHEIRTPMNAILGLLQLLQSTELTHRQLDYIVKSQSAAKSLLGLINDILDLSKMETGKLELDPQPFLFSTLLRDLSVILSTGANNQKQEVLFDVSPDIPKALVGDVMRLKQILINLGGNAIKFTPQGTVVLQIRVATRSEASTTLNFAVIDTGIGISPEQQERIFDNFSQAEASTTRRFGGTGLGLSICKKLVHLMGSELKVDSALGQGSTFHFTLTLPNTDQVLPVSDVACAALSGPLDVLVVDDSSQSLEIMSAMVQSLGWNVDLASSGAEAVARVQARKQAAQAPYKIMLVDWLMPEMDGWQTLARLQALFSTDERPLSIMVTAHDKDMLDQSNQHEHVQLDGYLVKPITASTLYDALVEAEAIRRLGPTVSAPVTMQHTLDGLRVLLVEDNLINQQVAKELLQGQGALVEVADNGQLGVEAVAQAQPMFDVVLMDIQMPVMDGFTATQKIRQELGHKDLPIIAITANAMSSDREDCLAAGMNAHVGKPFDLEQLVALLQSLCPRVLAGAAPVPTQTQPVTPNFETEDRGPDYLDVEGSLKRLSGNSALYGRILTSYMQQLSTLPDQFDQCLQQGALTQAAQWMHTLKGLSATVGASYLAAQAQTIQDRLKNADSGPPLKALSNQLRDAVMATHATVQKLRPGLVPAAIKPVPLQVGQLEDDAFVLRLLNELQQLLQDADMRALEVHAEVRAQLGSRQGELGAQLDLAVSAFDFAQGIVECQKLIEIFDKHA